MSAPQEHAQHNAENKVLKGVEDELEVGEDTGEPGLSSFVVTNSRLWSPWK